MRKDWVLISIVGLILLVGLGLAVYLKVTKKTVIANPVPSSSVKEVAGENIAEAEFFSDEASVMYFYSDFCHWCQKEKDEVLTELGKEGYKVKPMNVGEKPDLGREFNVTGTPTFVAANGDQLVGFQEAGPLKSFLDQHQ